MVHTVGVQYKPLSGIRSLGMGYKNLLLNLYFLRSTTIGRKD